MTLGELAVRFGCELRGEPQLTVDHVAGLAGAGQGALSFFANPKLKGELTATRATAVVLAPRSLEACPVAALIDPNPHAAFARMAELLHPTPPVQPGVHPTAIVHSEAVIDPSAQIGALCVIGARTQVGPDCLLGPACILASEVKIGAASRLVARVTLEAGVQIGARVLIHPGVVIGADGFGLARDQGRWLKVPQVGTVRIGDDVEIGANTTIDRGAIEDTVIAEGVKLDNQIQIGHNVRIGAHTAVAGCTAIAGSTQIGARCMIGGAAIVAGHLEICDDAVITGSTTVSRSIREPGVYSSGMPTEPQQRWRRLVAYLHRVAAGRAGLLEPPLAEQEADDD